ncbi:MAG: glycine zipper 2TM domain-containing protein [Novosphingobium sp.]|nr:glycine zipper 2TM domain-containing protein [Novosphingobium sp.]
MLDKCQGVERRHSGTTGAVIGGVIGGVVGGVVGNRIASGNRVLGTVAGAAVGAVVGGAVGKSIDRNRQSECEEFFSSYAPPPGYGPAQPYPGVFPSGAPGYPPYGFYPAYGYVMVPILTTQGCCSPCTETRTTTVTYVRERARKVYKVVPVKRVKEKRVYMGS